MKWPVEAAGTANPVDEAAAINIEMKGGNEPRKAQASLDVKADDLGYWGGWEYMDRDIRGWHFRASSDESRHAFIVDDDLEKSSTLIRKIECFNGDSHVTYNFLFSSSLFGTWSTNRPRLTRWRLVMVRGDDNCNVRRQTFFCPLIRPSCSGLVICPRSANIVFDWAARNRRNGSILEN